MVKTLTGSSFLSIYSHNIWFNRILFIIGVIFTVIIVIFHCIMTYIHYKRNKIQREMCNNTNVKHTKSENKKYKVINNIMIILIIVFTFLYQIQCLLGFFGINYQWFGLIPDCGYFVNLLTIWWHSSKFCIYYTFLIRIKLVFNNTAYEYSPKILYTLTSMITLLWIYGIFGDMTEIYGSYQYIKSENTYWCQSNLAMFGLIFMGFLDSILSVFCLVLFIKPLIKILKNASRQKTTLKLQNFVIRYFLLAFISIVSTAILMIFSIFFKLAAFAAIDVDINIICVLFMSSYYQKYYYMFCGSCHSTIAKCNKSKSSIPNNETCDSNVNTPTSEKDCKNSPTNISTMDVTNQYHD